MGGTGQGGQGSDGEPPGGVVGSGLADSIALDAARDDPGLEARTAAYLDEQTRLLKLQAGHLRQQHVLDLSHLRHRRWTDRLGLGLQVLAMAAGLAVAGLVGLAGWDAAHDRDLVIQPFSAAPELVARGVTGEVLATHMLDRLAALQDETDSLRAASSYGDTEPSDIKVEAAQTGMSLGEIRRYIVELLGRETRISGDAVRNPDGGLAVTARVGDLPGQAFRGADADLDRLVDLSAEQVFCATRLYRCAIHLDSQGRPAEALAVLDRLSRTGSQVERIWALSAATAIYTEVGDTARAVFTGRRGLAIDPSFVMLHWRLSTPYAQQGQAEAELTELRTAAGILQRAQPNLDQQGLIELRQAVTSNQAAAMGDFQSAIGSDQAMVGHAFGDDLWRARLRRLRDATGLHDRTLQDLALAALERDPPPVRLAAQGATVRLAATRLALTLERAETAALPAGIATLRSALAADPAHAAPGLTTPVLARAQIATGDLAGAQATLNAAPADCYACAIARGELARAQGNPHEADSWFIRASQLGPSLPFADEAWGRVELARGHLSIAPGRFASAVRRAPRWADPQKGWGDVLALQGQWREALDHYDAALKLAPTWRDLQQARAAAAAHVR